MKNKQAILMWAMMLILISIIPINSFNFRQLRVTPTSTVINTITQYRVEYRRTQDNNLASTNFLTQAVPATAVVLLTFPIEYSLNSSIQCTVQINSGTATTNACTLSGNQITLSSVFSSSTILQNLIVTVSNVLNPRPAITTGNFLGSIGVDVAVPTNRTTSQAVARLTAANFQSCSITFSTNFMNRTNQDMIFTITPTNPLTSVNSIQVKFPQNRWINDISTVNYLPISSSMICQNTSSNVLNTLQCVGDVNNIRVTANNLFSSTVSTTFSFSIKGFLSPPTNQPSDIITITSLLGANAIDNCTAYVGGLIPNTLTSVQITNTDNTNFIVNYDYILRFNIVLSDTLSQTDTIVVTTPSDAKFTLNFITSDIGIDEGSAVQLGNNITMSMIGTSTFPSGSSIVFGIGDYITPPHIRTTNPFTVTVNRNSFPKLIGTATITPVISNVTGTVTATVKNINTNTSYTFVITLNDPLSSTGKIVFIIPSTITIAVNSNSCASVSGRLMNSLPFCTVNSALRNITITSLNSSSSEIPQQQFTITINGLINPNSIAPTSSFSILTYYFIDDDSQVAAGTIPGITATKSTILSSNVAITLTSYTVLASPTTYNFKISIVDAIPVGGYLLLNVPPQITLISSLTSNCRAAVNSQSLAQTTCTLSSQQINFTNPFSIVANSNFEFQLTGVVTNPISTATTSSFAIYIYSSDSYQITEITSGLAVKMTTPNGYNSITVTRTSNMNYALNSYTVTINQNSPMAASSIASITFPNTIVPNNNLTCQLTTPSSLSLNCTLSTQTVTVVIPTPILASQSFAIKINSVRNPPSFNPPTSFTLQTRTPDNVSKYSSGTTLPSFPINIPTPFSSISYAFSDRTLDTQLNLTITFTPSPSTMLPKYLRITIPSYFIVSNISCYSFIDFTGQCNQQDQYTYNVSGNYRSSAMTFSVTGIKSPTAYQSNFIVLNSFDQLSYKIDESSTDITFTTICTLPCKTCTSNTSFCLNCYQNPSVSPNIYFDSDLNQCLLTCANGKYANNILFTCSNCSTNCLTCQTTSTYCLTCNTNSTFPYLNITNTARICVNGCDSGFYPSANVPITCVACVPPCLTCTTVNRCLSCTSGTFFYNFSCSSTCPTGTTVANNATNNCDFCSSNCLSCSGTISTCTACNSTLLLSGTTCLTQCLSPLAAKNGVCTACEPACKTCSKVTSNCTSCNANSTLPYYYNFNCLNRCPETFYNDIGNAICGNCALLTINCKNCSSTSTCLTCDLGYVFLSSSCLSTVPVGYVNISGYALPCTNNCATCSIATNNCTSCASGSLFNYQCLTQCPNGFVSINNTCVSCLSPCRSCSIITTNCTSCLPGLSPQVYFNNFFCGPTCPDFYYGNLTNNTCMSCVSPCLKCTSSVTCTSCQVNFLYQTSCVPSCPTQFIGINNVCISCASPCNTCTNSSSLCLSCVNGTYLLESAFQCLTNCGTGLYIDSLLQKCIGCTSPCKTCVNTSTTCLSCINGSLESNQCVDTCPDKKFPSNGVCTNCPASCANCTSLTVCSGCLSNYYLYLNFCISACPDTAAPVVNGSCRTCSTPNCYRCTAANVCIECNSAYSLLLGRCYLACPSTYTSNGTHCIQSLEATLTASPSSFPVPFSIAAAIMIVACLMSKIQFNYTFMPGALYSLLSIHETGCLMYLIYLYYVDHYATEPLPLLIMVAALVYLYVVNIISAFIQTILLYYDKSFMQWNVGANKCSFSAITILSLVLNHKLRNVMFCKLFSFGIFRAKLDDVGKFRIFNIFSFLSLLHSGAALFGTVVAISKVTFKTQVYYQCIDVIVITSFMVVLAFWNVDKAHNFFEEVTNDGSKLHYKVHDEQSIENKLDHRGEDGEEEIGFQSNFKHALNSNLPLVSNSHQQFYDDSSIDNITEKVYQEASVQALELIDRSFNQVNFVDLSTINHNKNQASLNITLPEDKVDKSIQNYIEHSDKSIQPSIKHYPDHSMQADGGNMVDQSVDQHQQYLVDRSIQDDFKRDNMVDRSIEQHRQLDDKSIQRTVFYQQDRSMQYTPSFHQLNRQDQSVSMSNKLADRSAGKDQPAVYKDQSVSVSRNLNEQSFSNKQVNVRPSLYSQFAQYSTIERKDEGVQNYQMLQDRSMQAVQTQISKANQMTIENNQRSVQMSRKTQKDYSMQKGVSNKSYEVQAHIKPDPVEYDEYTDQLAVGTSDKVIFEEEEPDTLNHHPAHLLGQQEKAHLNIPKQQLKSYQQELEDRIRDKEKELAFIKNKVISKERENSKKKKQLSNKDSDTYVVDVGTIYQRSKPMQKEPQQTQDDPFQPIYKMPPPNIPLRKEQRQLNDELSAHEQNNTLEEIQIIEQQYNNKQQINPYQQRSNQQQYEQEQDQLVDMNGTSKTEQKIIDMLSNNNNQILYQDNNKSEEDIDQKPLSFKKNILPYEQVSGGDVSEQKAQYSTKFNSTNNRKYPKMRKSNEQYNQSDNHGLFIVEVDNSMNSNQSINDRPKVQPYKQIARSDAEDLATKALGNTGGLGNKIKMRQRRTLEDQERKVRKPSYPGFNTNKNLNEEKPVLNKERSTLQMAGKSTFAQEGLKRKVSNNLSPLKQGKKWQIEYQDKNLSDSGEINSPRINKKNQKPMVLPFETDRQQTQFKSNQLKASDYVIIPRNQRIPIQHSMRSNQPKNQQPVTITRFGSFNNEHNKVPSRPIFNNQGTDLSDEPYIESQSDYVSKYRKNMILDQMQERPQNRDLKQYYKEHNKSRSKEKNKSKSKYKGLEKIYLQKLNRNDF